MLTARSPIRSRSLLIFMAATMNRKSTATGWCRARIFEAFLLDLHLAMVDVLIALFDAVGQIGIAFQQGPDRHLHLVLDDRTEGENALLQPLDLPLQVYRHDRSSMVGMMGPWVALRPLLPFAHEHISTLTVGGRNGKSATGAPIGTGTFSRLSLPAVFCGISEADDARRASSPAKHFFPCGRGISASNDAHHRLFRRPRVLVGRPVFDLVAPQRQADFPIRPGNRFD